MSATLRIRIGLWLIVIGAIALVAPAPAWHPSLAAGVLAAGVVLVLTSLSKALGPKPGGRDRPDA